MPANLAPVYLDDTRVTLQGDPRPKVAKILQAGGRPLDARVLRVEGPAATGPGKPLGPDEVIDRTGDPGRPVHLRTSSASAPGTVRVPGDILRGTDPPASRPPSGPAGAGGNPPKAQRFAENQSFADPVHKGGSPEGATSLDRASEEE